MRCIDLFSGAGGLTRGLHAAGWETIGAVEYDAAAAATYRANFPSVDLFVSDVREMTFELWRGEVDLVAGGPPCQPFSVAGLQRAAVDPRDCVPEFVRAVASIAPEAFLMENVANLANPRHTGYLRMITRSLEKLGFVVRTKVLDAADYGVPQFRRRLFVVGMRGQAFRFPEATHGPGRGLAYADSRSAVANAPSDEPNRAIVTYAKKPVLRPQPFDGMLVNGGGRPINLDEPCQTIPASAGGNRTHIVDEAGVLVEYHAHLMEGGEPRQGIVEGVRRLTVAESAAVQTFPPEHVILGRTSARYRQIGNAVPPRLAEAVAAALLEQVANAGASTLARIA